MKRLLRILIISAVIFVLSSFSNKEVTSAEVLITKMLEQVNRINTLAFTFSNTERIEGKLLSGELDIKLCTQPRKYYLHFKNPNPGAEVLFVEGANSNKAIFEPNGFPYIKLELDPFGSTMKKNNHHTIYELGFGYMAEILAKNLKANKSLFTHEGVIYKGGKSYSKINFTNNDFKFITYKVNSTDKLRTIAKKFGVSEYMISEANKEIYEVTPGHNILVPNCYAKRIEILIDNSNHLPHLFMIYDDKGLFEKYQYTNISVNPVFSNNTFNTTSLGKKIKS